MNMKMIRGGAFPTMVTPYNKAGDVDYGAVRAMTEWYWEKGCDGIFASCQSSEIHELSLADRARLSATVLETAESLARGGDRPRMTVVASGHVSRDRAEQEAELRAVAETGCDALILISNRMDAANLSEDAWLKDTEHLMNVLPEEIPLGVYECPRPYKRLLSDRMLSFCAQSGRFAFMKDTCCDAAVIARRMKLLEGTPMLLLNANGQTLLDSLRAGAHGYCGVMCNFHPELFVWLCHNFEKDPARADLVQSFLGCAAFLESLAYPVIAKYHLKEIEGLPLESISARTRDERECTEYHRACIRQMDLLARHIKTLI